MRVASLILTVAIVWFSESKGNSDSFEAHPNSPIKQHLYKSKVRRRTSSNANCDDRTRCLSTLQKNGHVEFDKAGASVSSQCDVQPRTIRIWLHHKRSSRRVHLRNTVTVRAHMITYIRGSAYRSNRCAVTASFGCTMTDELQATIFRLPLRTTQQAASSRISPRPFTAANAEELLVEFAAALPELALFLTHIHTVEVSVWQSAASSPPSFAVCGSLTPRVVAPPKEMEDEVDDE